MKVKAITDYNDLQLKKLVIADEVLDVSEERANALIKAKVAVVITDDEPVEKAPEAETTEPAEELPEEKPKKKPGTRAKNKEEA